MWYYILKVLISAVLIVTISEVGKKSSFWGAVLASLPLTSILAICWLYYDTQKASKVMDLSIGIFWITLPSLVFFVMLFVLMKYGFDFFPSMVSSILIMSTTYTAYVYLLKKLGIEI